MALEITLVFDGYWREVNKSSIPAKSGVYCVYACTFNQEKGTVSIRKLLYIGESEDANKRIANHDRFNDWKKQLQTGETLCYNFAPVISANRVRAEASLIYKHKPPLNEEYKNSFPFAQTTIIATGTNALLIPKFTVG